MTIPFSCQWLENTFLAYVILKM
uniref:Uncharacterized protein n=1 Tax=Romanomermis culicivorax TaxID=13658 RepID=A0A915HQ57_ROMCU